MNQFVLSPEAAQDLIGIWEYIAADEIQAADRLLAELRDQMIALAKTPSLGHRREDLAEDRPLLFWPEGNHQIIYRFKTGPIEIVAVTHCKRDIPVFLEQRGL